MQRWFLIDDRPSSGAINMAWDELILSKVEKEGGEPFLRLYSFAPPAITIGYHQDPGRILDAGEVGRGGMDLVRRITGGRALLHEGELTYCVAAPAQSPPFGAGLQETFLSIAGALVGALRSVGVQADIACGKPGRPGGAMVSPCLASASRHEIVSGGRKIAGSAQRRTRSAFLQHGSIFLRPASEGITRYLKGDWGDLGSFATNVAAEGGGEITDARMREALKDSFSETFGAFFEPFVPGRDDLEFVESRSIEKAAEFAGFSGGMKTG